MTDVSVGFRPPCWNPSGLHTKNISLHILKNCCDLNLGEGLCIFTFFLFSDSGLFLLDGFYFYYAPFGMA